jgi:putative ABC transport system substrate-binding protein
MTTFIGRREFITLLGGAVSAWPLATRAEVSRKRPLIGRLSSGSKDVPPVAKYIDRFLAGMRELGYVEGRDFDMTYAMADFHADRLPQVTAELVKLAPDVILAGGTLEAVAARKATTTIPIVGEFKESRALPAASVLALGGHPGNGLGSPPPLEIVAQ